MRRQSLDLDSHSITFPRKRCLNYRMTGVMYGDHPITVNGCRWISVRQDKAETRKLADQYGVIKPAHGKRWVETKSIAVSSRLSVTSVVK